MAEILSFIDSIDPIRFHMTLVDLTVKLNFP